MSSNTNSTKNCRTCLNVCEDMYNLFAINEYGLTWKQMINHLCSNIEINVGDGFPDEICSKCAANLIQTHLFHKMCHSSEVQLKSFLNQKSPLENPKITCYHLQTHKPTPQAPTSIQTPNTPIQPAPQNSNQQNHPLSRICPTCNKTFRYRCNLERHMLTHTGEKPFLCNFCGKAFTQLATLRTHSNIHTGEKPYECETCGRRFAAPGTLASHVKIHTGERPNSCKICGKQFLQSGYLRAHIRTHTGEKPLECQVCHRRFNQSGFLRVHMRVHSGEKPYSCEDCGKRFAVRGTLVKHVRTHTGEKPYVCKICGLSFAQNGTLYTHMKVHKAKE